MKTKITLLFTFMFTVGSITAQTLEAGYQMNGDYTDSSGNGYNLYATGWDGSNSAFDTTSPAEGSSFFRSDVDVDANTFDTNFLRTEDGGGNIVFAPSSITGDNPRTITAWVKMADIITNHRGIAGLGTAVQGETNKRFDLIVRKDSGLLRCEKAGAGFDATVSVGDGNWYFVAVTYTSGSANLYVGSSSTAITASVGSAAWTGLDTTVAAPIIVGAGAQTNRVLYGGLDDVRFYSGALSIAQLNTVRTGGTLGIKDMAFGANELKAYPTIVTDVLNIETTVSEKLSVTVHNILGKTVSRSYGSQVDMTDLATGMYIVNVRAGAKVGNIKVLKK